jgi:hypothetical protein
MFVFFNDPFFRDFASKVGDAGAIACLGQVGPRKADMLVMIVCIHCMRHSTLLRIYEVYSLHIP